VRRAALLIATVASCGVLAVPGSAVAAQPGISFNSYPANGQAGTIGGDTQAAASLTPSAGPVGDWTFLLYYNGCAEANVVGIYLHSGDTFVLTPIHHTNQPGTYSWTVQWYSHSAYDSIPETPCGDPAHTFTVPGLSTSPGLPPGGGTGGASRKCKRSRALTAKRKRCRHRKK
jgi:hypothetical protein